MKTYNLALSIALFSMVISCGNESKKQEAADKSNSPTKEQINTAQSSNGMISSDGTMPKVYELKEDGVYIYSDANPIVEVSELGCKKYVQKNFKYIYVPSSKDLIKKEDGPKSYQICDVTYTCENDYGKPSLKELGYERHQEREIKPEDNRFGVAKKEPRTIVKKEKKIQSETNYLTIPKSAFKELSRTEFIENGIVVIGKHISRVVIKSLDGLPKFADRVVVESTTKVFDCSGKEVDRRTVAPKELADFKKIHFKENIFEFIEEEPIPGNSAYLSDEEFMKLTNDVHQLIPRIYDRTIHNVAYYYPGYYIIEYYNGDKLYEYQCIKITDASCEPKLWDKLETKAPTSSADIKSSNEKCYLVIADFANSTDAKNFIKKKPTGDALLYHLPNGKTVLAVVCENKKKAETEMKRYTNMGFKKESLRIEQY